MQNSRQIALVIGSSSGIGLEVCKQLVSLGLTVYGGARSETVLENVNSLTIDVTNPQTISAAVDKIIEEKGALDMLIYSAGFSMASPLEHATDEDMRYLFEVNYFGAVNAIKAVLPHMRKVAHGRIVLISSVGGTLPIAFDPFYSSSKAALNILADELNMELNPFNIYVTSVCPGGTATRFTFKRKVYPDGDIGVYADALNKATISLANIEQGGMPASAVADAVIKVLSAATPPVKTTCGITNKSYMLFDRLLPTRLTSFLNKNIYKQ